MLSPAQLRAARGLLDWTRADLAKAANVSPETIKNIEHGTFRPQEQTEQSIIKAFYRHQVEFIEDNGVCFRDDTLSVFEGGNPYLQVLQIAQGILQKQPAELLFTFAYNLPATAETLKAEKDLQAAGCKFRLIVDKSNLGSRYPQGEYRAIPQKYFQKNDLHLVFADRVATFLDSGAKIIMVRNQNIANTHRSVFAFLWDHGENFTPDR